MTTPSALRSRLSLRQRQTRYAATSTAATAAMTSRADMTAESTSAELGHERAGQLARGRVGARPVGEEAEAGGPGAADCGAEGACCHQRVEALSQLVAERERGRLEVVVERGRQHGERRGREAAERFRVELVAGPAEPVEL